MTKQSPPVDPDDRTEPVEAPDGGEASEHRPPPARGGRPGRATRRVVDPSRPCLNCGDPTPGEYCRRCGQRKAEVRVSVRALIMDVLEDQFILDKRLPKTLGALFFKPGRLTIEHVNGRIARYIHPFRLYLVTSLIFFVLLSFLSVQAVRGAMDGGDEDAAAAAEGIESAEERAAAVDSLRGRLDELESSIGSIEETLADTALPAPARAGVAAGRSSLLRQRTATLQRLRALEAVDTVGAPPRAAPAPPGRPPGDGAAAADTAGAASPRQDEPAGQRGNEDEPRTLAEAMGWDDDPPEVETPWPAADSAIAQQIDRLGAMPPRAAAETLVGTFFNWVPTLMFLLLPVFASVLKLLYIRRGRYYAEHFVFLLHVHSFVFLVSTVMLLIRNMVPLWVELVLGVAVLAYIYMAMLRVYAQGWLKTFVKYWVLGWSYFWILVSAAPFALLATLLLF